MYTASICGHSTKLTGKVSAFGHETTTEMPLNDKGTTNYCLDCIGKMAIRCGFCKEVIFIGDPVCQGVPLREGYKLPEGAREIRDDRGWRVIGCLRWNCAATGAVRSGFWYPPGEVYRVPSPIEVALATRKAVSCGDVTDPRARLTVDSRTV